MLRTFMVLSGAVMLIAGMSFAGGDEGKSIITPGEAHKLLKTDTTVVVLDVRTPAEFTGETGHLARALLIPVQDLEQRVGELSKYKKHTVVVYCRTGHRSTTATEILKKHGFKALNMVGGITRWRAESLPVIRENTSETK